MIILDQVAGFVNGQVLGDGNTEITGLSRIEMAKKGDITFAMDPEELGKAEKSQASCILTAEDTKNCAKPVLKVDDMKMAITVIYNAMLTEKKPAAGRINETAVISDTAVLGKNISLGPWVSIGGKTVIGDGASISANVVIGDNCVLGNNVVIYPNVTLYNGIIIGNNVIIHSGTVIGADGFGFVPKGDKIYKVPQLCGVKIEDDVEIGANVCIDRGAFTDTVIGKGSKLDNLIQIAHNCKIGNNVLIAGQSGIAGSTVIGDNTMMGGNVGISDHAEIGKNVKIAAKSAVMGKVKDGSVIMGYPAIEAKEYLQIHALMNVLRKKSKQLRSLLRKDK